MIKRFIYLALIVASIFVSSNVSASVFVTPDVTGVIADSMYHPNVTYPEWSTISGNYLYHGANWGNTMSIVDISDPLNPVELSSLSDGDTGATVKNPKGSMVVGDYLYFINWNNATGDESVEILNIADKRNPYHVANYIFSVGTGDRTYSLFVKDDYIYVAAGSNNKLIILDARDKNNVVLAGSISNGTGGAKLSTVYGVSVVGNYAFVSTYASDALEVIDVTDKTNPVHYSYLVNGTGGAKLDGAAAIVIVGDYAYINAYNSKALEIVDISNPAAPTHVGSIADGTDGAIIMGYELAVNGNYAYLSSYNSKAIEVINISDPANPTHAGVIQDGDGGAAINRPRAISYYNNTVYVSVTGSNRIEIIDVSDPSTPTHINQIDPVLYLGGARFVKVRDNLAYVTSNVSNGLQIVDISNKNNPIAKGWAGLRFGGAQFFGPLGLDLKGDYAYIVSTGSNYGNGGSAATWGALEIMDISDPNNPTHLNSIVGGDFSGAYTGGAQDIKIVGDYAYITAPSRRAVLIFDIGTDPVNPTLVGSVLDGAGGATLVSPFGIDVVGDYAYITTSNALEILDISNPASPTHVSSLVSGTGGALLTTGRFLKVIGSYAYIAASGNNALEIVDVSDPLHPVHAGSLVNGSGGALLAGAYGISVFENRAYIGSSNSNALEIVDVSDPTNPTHLYSISDGSDNARLISARGVDNDGEYVYVTAYNGSSNALNIIRVKATAPSNLSYNNRNSYIKNRTISNLSPSVSGTDLTYSISPELPDGLSISSSTGIISGTPTVTLPTKTYTVTAINSAGSTSFSFTIAVDSGYSPIVLPPAIGHGAQAVSIDMGGTLNIGGVNNKGINVLAYINSQADFKTKISTDRHLADYSLKITDLDLYRNIITVKLSTQKELSLNKGETVLVDLDNDGINDVSLKFVDVYVNRAELTIESLEGKNSVVENITENKIDETVANNSKEEKSVEKTILINKFIFNNNLNFGMTNSDVKELQKYLNQNGYVVSESGPGSVGSETNFFGSATRAAVIKFQKINNINPPFGFFGPLTRKTVNK